MFVDFLIHIHICSLFRFAFVRLLYAFVPRDAHWSVSSLPLCSRSGMTFCCEGLFPGKNSGSREERQKQSKFKLWTKFWRNLYLEIKHPLQPRCPLCVEVYINGQIAFMSRTKHVNPEKSDQLFKGHFWTRPWKRESASHHPCPRILALARAWVSQVCDWISVEEAGVLDRQHCQKNDDFFFRNGLKMQKNWCR